MKRSTATAIAVFIAVATGTARADTVTEWNQTAIEVMKVARVAGNPWSRALAMMHVAMSDAINSVQDRYTRSVATVPVAPGASAEAAAAAAARRILVDLFPSQKAAVEAAYAASLRAIPDGSPKSQGVALGEQVAAAVQADRATDGAQAPDTYRPVTSPTVSAHHANAGHTGSVEVRPGGGCDVVVDVDGGHASRGTDEMSEKRGVVARAGTDLEHPVAGPHVELLEHDGHDLGLRGRADDLAIGQALCRDRAIPVRVLNRHVGNEEVSRHGGERRRDRWRGQGALRPQRLDEGRAEYGEDRDLIRGAHGARLRSAIV